MAASHGSLAKVSIGGYDASPFIKDISEDCNVEASEITGLGSTSKSYIPGIEETTIKGGGYFDSNSVNNTTSWTAYLYSLKRTITQLSYMPQGDSLGYPAQIASGILTSATVGTSVSGAATCDFAMQNKSINDGSTPGLCVGVVLRPSSTVSGVVTNQLGTSVDGLTASTNGLSAVLQVYSVTGTGSPTLTVTLQDSADNVTFADIASATFSAATAQGSKVLSTPAGSTVRRYVRIKYSTTGTSPAFTFGVQMARN